MSWKLILWFEYANHLLHNSYFSAHIASYFLCDFPYILFIRLPLFPTYLARLFMSMHWPSDKHVNACIQSFRRNKIFLRVSLKIVSWCSISSTNCSDGFCRFPPPLFGQCVLNALSATHYIIHDLSSTKPRLPYPTSFIKYFLSCTALSHYYRSTSRNFTGQWIPFLSHQGAIFERFFQQPLTFCLLTTSWPRKMQRAKYQFGGQSAQKLARNYEKPWYVNCNNRAILK